MCYWIFLHVLDKTSVTSTPTVRCFTLMTAQLTLQNQLPC